MLVAIDIGNTNVTYGWFEKDSDEVRDYATIKTDRELTTDDLAIRFFNLMKLWKVENERIEAVVISNVVPQLEYPFKHLFEKYYGLSPQFLRREKLPIEVCMDHPDEVGADRLINALAVYQLYPKTNVIVVDFGTATNFDLLDSQGRYLGGAIVPGILSSLRSMEAKAAKLPHIDLSVLPDPVGKNTVDAIRSGVLYGSGAMVDGMVDRFSAFLGWQDFKVISTGGLSDLIRETSQRIEFFDRFLTLKGLYYFWKLN